ncbi:MAG TPA: Uma2 family endonuclease [Planctomycetota bacterium]|nr:Uma2 family endonuclease [Planctomycetota bacterium]
MIAENSKNLSLPGRPLPKPGKWTYEDWVQLPEDGNKYEVLDGELYVTPPPTFAHQDHCAELLVRMRLHARQFDLGKVVAGPLGVRLPNQPVPVEPDIVFVRKARESIIKAYIEGTPDLVVELLSPGNRNYDRVKKFSVYESAGVSEYWIVDDRDRCIEVFNLKDGAYVLSGKHDIGATAGSTVLPGFGIPVADVFSS